MMMIDDLCALAFLLVKRRAFFFLDDSAPGAQKKSEMSRRLPNTSFVVSGGLFCVEKNNKSQKPRLR